MKQKAKAHFLKKATATLMLVFSVFIFIARPFPVSAQYTDFAALAQRTTIQTIETMKKAALKAEEESEKAFNELMKTLGAVLYKNTLKVFVQNLLSETATWIASGGEGQKPLIYTNEWGDYLKTAGENAAAGLAIDFAEEVLKTNICMSPDVAIDILLPTITPPKKTKPRCSLAELKKKWDVTDPKFLENFSVSFETGQNDLGIAVSFLTGLQLKKEKKVEEAIKERENSDGFKDAKKKISKIITTPGSMIREKTKEMSESTGKIQFEYTGILIADVMDSFVGTLASQYSKKMQDGFFSLADLVGKKEDRLGDARKRISNSLINAEATGPSGESSAEIQFKDVFKPEIQQVSDYNILAELSACPTEVSLSKLYNCTIDSSFSQAIVPSGSDGFLTVRQAVNKNLLHGDWSFGYVDPGTGTEPSYLNGYAYSNMKKLRRLRILPVGWEMAAMRTRELGTRVTLQNVLDDYNEPASPFYHLVDPDWVLKIPEARCTANVSGQILKTGGASRVKTCVDIQDCIAFGQDGECLSWGYCTNDKRVWRFPAESCSSQFSTCEQYIGSSSTQDQDNVWLGSTLDYTGCSAQTAGCNWYSVAKDARGTWLDSNRVYLNKNAKNCLEEDAGCKSYIGLGRGTNMLRNSSFEDDGGHNYVLGTGDQTDGNGVPDGWSARQSTISLEDDNPVHGLYSVKIIPSAGSNCLNGLQYTAPAGSFEVGQTYVLSGRVKTNSKTARNLRLSFKDIPFTVQSVVDNWQSFAFNFIMPATSTNYVFILGGNGGECGDLNVNGEVFYDAIQLEKGTQATVFKPYGEINKINLKNAPACTFQDVGCQRFLPLNKAIGSEVTAVATGADLCPQECIGYATYQQRATELEPAGFVNFIAKTASVCPAQEVGCEKFTNLDVLDKGGEGTEYYSRLRHCEKPQPRCASYFAWEGSDVSGYQLMSYSLLAGNSNGTGAPQTTDNSTTCDPNDADCRELIDEAGNRYVRNLAVTITCSEECVPLRASADLVDKTECEDRLGKWDETVQRCVYQAIPEESRQCQDQSVGCREYIGNTGHNVAVIFADGFEKAGLEGWSSGEISTEATSVGGHSLRLGPFTRSINVSTRVDVKNIVPGKSYLIEMAAKSSISDPITVTAYLGVNQNSQTRLGAFVNSTITWGQYELGSVYIPVDAGTVLPLVISVTGSTVKPDDINFYLDNIRLRQIKDSVFAVKNSWQTPATCDTDPPLSGGSAGRSMVGCKAYSIEGDSSGQIQALKSFSRLCSEEKIGCQAVLDTFNSQAPYREIFQEDDEAEIVVPEDRVTYLVNRDEFSCDEAVSGCMELGRPNFTQDGDLGDYESTYLINDPNRYNEILCPGESVSCEEFQTSAGTIVYAKNPKLQQCEYREAPNSFPPRFAWFKVGDTEENPDDCLLAEENSFVRRCPISATSCTEYLEPITQEAFYYKKNSLKQSAKQCNGVVDWKQGCVLFNDLSVRDQYFMSGDPNLGRDSEGRRLETEEAELSHINFSGSPRGCQTGDAGCDTNILLKVNLDRKCSQWLTGVSQSRFWDRSLQQFRTTSYGLGRCVEYDSLNPTICRRWNNDPDKPLLTIGAYQARDLSWAGEDYSGYSIPNLYPVETLRQRSVSADDDGNPNNFRLTRLINPGSICANTTDCAIGQVCRLELNESSGQYEGRCYVEEGLDGQGSSVSSECRGYPEDDSPFPSSLAVFNPETDEKNPGRINAKDQLFTNANIGENNEDVECSYHKVNYGGQDLYFGLNTVPPSTIILEGNKNDYLKKSRFIGWEGYCLERDPSRKINGADNQFACLTWYPVDVIQGAYDFNNSSIQSGYLPGDDRQYYCVEAVFGEYRKTFYNCARGCPSGYNQIGTSSSSTCGGSAWRICEPVQGEGWYAYNGNIDGQEQLGMICQKVARIQDAAGNNRAWTTRILGQKLPGAKEYFVEDLGWGFIQQNPPYGAARPLVTRIGDLGQPLLVLSPHDFIDSCEDCKVEEGDIFGTCQDEEPDRKGRKCPLSPNAGSPYSLNAEINPAILTDNNVPIRRDNKLPADDPQPYPGSEDYQAGFRRLQQLFARSYGVYEWQSVQNVCVGVCSGGVNSGKVCESNSSCGDPNEAISYTCKTGTCVGGAKNNQDCAVEEDCKFDRTDVIHQCVAEQGIQDPGVPQGYICESGPWAGQPCTNINDCKEDTADGICSSEQRCQAKNSNDQFTTSVLSGMLCSSTEECNAKAFCAVQRCSTEPEGTNSNICVGKTAGDTCSSGVNTSQYVAVSANDLAVGWDLVTSNPAITQSPIVRPVVPNPGGSGFVEGSTRAITVNGSTSGNISAQDGRAPVTVSFYAYNENGEQMPLRLVMVDWGDGTDPAQSRGSFKNHKHRCRKFCSNAIGIACTFDAECQDDSAPNATCQPFNFGDSDGACLDDTEGSNGYFSFSYTYTCEGPRPCVYRPEVMVRDNWGATTVVSYNGDIIIQPRPQN